MSDKNETVENDGEDLAATVASLQSQLEKLAAKNKELIGEKQAAKQAALKAAEDAEEAKTSAAEKNGDIETLKAQHAKALKAQSDAYETLNDELRTIRVDNEIANGLTSNNVRPELARAVTAMMKAEATYKDGVASIDGQPISEYMKSFLGSKDGAHFVRAADNSGSGAAGSASATASVANKPWSLTAYTEMKQNDPAGAAAWANKEGHGYLNQA